MKTTIAAVPILLLVACGGSDRYYVGGVLVEPDARGNVVGVGPDDLTLVTEETGGFVYGLALDVDALIVGRSGGAARGDRGAFTVAGVLPDPNLGAPFTAGTASYTGAYEMLVVTGYERQFNPDNWTEETFSGPITATVRLDQDDFDASDQRLVLDMVSPDGRVVYEDITFYDVGASTFDSRTVTTLSGDGYVLVNGEPAYVTTEMGFGEDGLVGAFSGEGNNALVAGGMVLEAN